MRTLKNLNLKNKLRAIILLTSSAALLIACAMFIAYDQALLRKNMVRDLSTLAEIIADRSTAAIAFNDPVSAKETLSALSAKQSIVTSCIYEDTGQMFTCYFRGTQKADFPPRPEKDGYIFRDSHLIMFRPIFLENERIGTVYIKADLNELNDILKQNAITAASVLLISFLVAFFLSSRLQRLISGPVLNLVQSAKTVSEKKDYSVRAMKESEDELGLLVDTFNEMLSQIQGRDQELTRHREQLEEMVEERTAELQIANKELLVAKESAEKATKAKSEFLSIMSHEIRTPLNAIIGMGEMLEETSLTPAQKEYLQLSKTSGDVLLALINDILDFSKIEAGHIELEYVDFNLRDLMEKTCDILAIRAHKKNIEVAFRVHPDVPGMIKGDPVRLRQVLINLIGNAIKFTDKGEVVIEARLKETESGGQGDVELLFSVKDTGIGVPKEKQDRIFDSFTQADSSTTRKYGGTGLGLSISKRLVELMGGRIWVESADGQGCVFYFSIHSQSASGLEEARPPAPTNLKDARILIADDSAMNRFILREILSEAGALVEEAESGPTALSKLDRAHKAGDPYKFVFLDCLMPGMDGFDIAGHIKKSPGMGSLPVMMLTTENRSSYIDRYHGLGIGGYLFKPIRRSNVHDSILSALGEIEEAEAETALKVSIDPGKFPPLKILLVDDAEENRMVVHAYLKGAPWGLDVAENGAMAVEKFKANKYDLVLMDMQMPVMDGYAATREIRKWEHETNAGETPVIALTAYALREESEKSRRAGCNSHITKPVKKALLLETILKHAACATQSAEAIKGKIPAHIPVDVQDYIPRFLERMRENLKGLQEASREKDFEAVASLGHKMKGTGASFGFEPISRIGIVLEQAGKGKNIEEIRGKIEEFSDYLERVVPVFKKEAK
ncbi:MAG: response regulator [Nitrospinae bacterium]|nr:response regulator [Nitrospinota bacterium]